MKFKSITYKWVFNFISVITLILILTNCIFLITLRQYFYTYAEQAIQLNADAHYNAINFEIKNESQDLDNKIKNIIENFTNSDNIMVIGLNNNGLVVANSDKILIYKNYELFKKCSQNHAKKANLKKINYLNNKEHVITYIKKNPIINSNISTIVYISSLEKIDFVIMNIIMITVILSLVMLFLIIISGMFFIKYFVDPVREINVVIKKIANGNMKYRIKKNYHYEIKELCDSINFMAKEIYTSEYIKNEFVSSVSHELRTPLTAIKGWSETILSTKDKDKEILSKGMDVISKEVVRLSEMVEDLLDFSKMQNGHFVLKKEKMDLFAELEAAVIMYSDIAIKEGKILEYNEKQELFPIIFGDRNRIRQVFINIIDNAIKYSEKGDKITIDSDVDNDNVTIVIKDTGCGITKKDIPHITKKFFKANLTKKGSGIGLAVVKEIVEKHDGNIKFESTKGKGTTVTLSFKIYK